MSRIVFESERPAAPFDTGRADVACFVGLVRRAGSTVPASVLAWLHAQGWSEGPYMRLGPDLFDVPVAIETWATFTSLFDPGGSSASNGTDYLAAAVRTFFAQGGKRCYVVRMGDPVAPGDNDAARQAKLQSLLPATTYRADDPKSWHGTGHLGGLPDVSFLALPDLPVLTAQQASGVAGQVPVKPTGPEHFVECSTADITPPQYRLYLSAAPRMSDYQPWANAVSTVLSYLKDERNRLKEVQFVVAFPLPQEFGAQPSSAALTQDIHDVIYAQMPEAPDNPKLSSAFLQLGYPWLKTTGSHVLLESLEPPDGALVGLLSRNALIRGTFTSATKVIPAEIFDVWPALPGEETRTSADPLVWDPNTPSRKPLIERLSLFGFTPDGLRLLSDVTAYAGESYRPARVNRLVSVISRASRRIGEAVTFDSNGPTLWSRVGTALKQVLTRLWQLGALDGASVTDAFAVRCDRSTMTQNDLDNGRMVAEVSFTAAATIELIRVTLAIEASGASSAITATPVGVA